MENYALNGFWGDLWTGFKSMFTSSTHDDNHAQGGGKTFGWRIGRFLSRSISSATSGVLDNQFKVTEYVPTASELVILNPLKDALNNWMIVETKKLDSYLANGDTASFIAHCNSVLAQLQMIREYYDTYQVSGLSDNACDFLAEQIEIMQTSYEKALEDLFIANGLAFSKVETTISKMATDTLPVQIAIPAEFEISGFQYQTASDPGYVQISTEVPVNDAVAVTPTNTTVTPATPTAATPEATKKKRNRIAFGIGTVLLIWWGFN